MMLSLQYLASLWEQYGEATDVPVAEFELAERRFEFNRRPAVMGVLNLSPDSWYRESVCLSTEQAVRRAQVLAAQGADVIDVGAESTLNHAARVDSIGQRDRLLPVVRRLREKGILVSVETYQAEVARACLEAGANILNLTGTEGIQEIYRMAADHDAAAILCLVQGKNVREVGDFQSGDDPMLIMEDYFSRAIEQARKNGLEKILIDPGLGFYYRNLQDSADRVRHQMKVFLNSFRLRRLGYPICHALPHAFEFFGDEVRSAEPFFAVLAALGRTDLFRTHEVPRIKAVLETMRYME